MSSSVVSFIVSQIIASEAGMKVFPGYLVRSWYRIPFSVPKMSSLPSIFPA